jgi:hypothetical protein
LICAARMRKSQKRSKGKASKKTDRALSVNIEAYAQKRCVLCVRAVVAKESK